MQEYFKNMMISANLGDPAAKSNVGLCYIEGDGVEKDEKEAIRWFVDAANNGDVLGQYCLGCCFLYGTGIEKDLQAALVWLKKAADKGFPQAINTLNQIK